MRKFLLLAILSLAGCGDNADIDIADAAPSDARQIPDASCEAVDCSDLAIDRITFRDCCQN